ncbi:allophanate hydrolase [Paenibacillus radicis (ex Xue et al. 2023)]|uniref:Allophanate hydrolase n=1 Tax=Paenibacillus radicis (ex Xue et al. 2023) TaxID=2972489 RepID=A0ABT1YFZ9_9BACL|nr:allophanate hydrolase [Paenibacillus radicis (ex Xue et al. 2023)]MCR8631640.1 allophanate hydrolase [Paenibacillus radicis (ex Xue et al. 2023)]
MIKENIPQELSLQWIRDKYLERKVTPDEIIKEIINRVNEDSEMNIWITPPTLERVQPYLDRLQALDPADLPLWGIPFAIKDNIDLAGVPTTAGCEEYAYTPNEHAAVVERLVAAGAIPLGKTNLDQFATGLVGTRSPYGETHNSLRPELISGGSSSGSAVAVARGHAVFSLGTDTAGSGRVPAALNRLVGYKPSLGAWSTKGVVPACASLDCVTVFAHSLEDALAVDSIARGVHSADPWSRNLPKPSPELPAKIYLPEHSLDFYGPYADEYSCAWNISVEKIKALNIPIEYIDYGMFSEAAAILYGGPLVAERWAGLGGFIESHPGVAFPVTEQVLRSGAAAEYDAASVFRAMHKLQAFKLAARELLRGAVMVMPTAGGTWTREQVRSNPIGANSDMGRYTNHCNLLDLCAVAVPSVDAASDTPFGVTWFALSENEGLICGAAEIFTNGVVMSAVALKLPEGAHAGEGGSNTLSVAANGSGVSVLGGLAPATTLVAVCGLHMRGFPLEQQMKACGARFIREASTAAKYVMVKLTTVPAKPGLIKRQTGGASIQLEVWEMPLEAFGSFAASIPAPLGIGKVELEDGSEVPGFVCEGYAIDGAEDITASGGWRYI